jgi:hypothetical protein
MFFFPVTVGPKRLSFSCPQTCNREFAGNLAR